MTNWGAWAPRNGVVTGLTLSEYVHSILSMKARRVKSHRYSSQYFALRLSEDSVCGDSERSYIPLTPLKGGMAGRFAPWLDADGRDWVNNTRVTTVANECLIVPKRANCKAGRAIYR